MSDDLTLVVIVFGLICLCSLGLNVYLEHRFARRDTALRLKLGSCRTALEASEADRAMIRRQFNAQAVELAQYRGAFSHDKRLTRVFTGLPEPPAVEPLGEPPDDVA